MAGEATLEGPRLNYFTRVSKINKFYNFGSSVRTYGSKLVV
jgi:hypothetical protein